MSTLRVASQQMLSHYVQLPTTVHVLCMGSFINRAGSFVILFLTIYVSEELGMGKTFASYCIGAFGLGSVVSSLIGGQLADQFGRRSTMLFALFGGAAALISLSRITNGWLFMAVLFLFAVIMEMYRPASSAMIGDVTPLDRRPHAFGLLYISMNLGFAVAPPIGGFLASQSFQWLFWGDAVTTALYGVVVLLLIRETRPPHRIIDSNERMASRLVESDSPVAAAEALASLDVTDGQQRFASDSRIPLADLKGAENDRKESARPESAKAALRHIAGDWTFLLFCFCSLLTNLVFMQAFVTLPLYLRGMGFNELQFGMMICVNGILIVLFQLPLTHMLSRYNRVNVILCGELLLALGFGLTVFADSAALIVGTIVLWTFGEILQAPYKSTIVTEMAPPSMRARYMGIFGISHSLSLTIGAPLGGEILARYGPNALWPGCFGLLLVTTALYIVMFRHLVAIRHLNAQPT